jgi:hypothetical protein
MPEFTLHFEAEPGTDIDSAATELQKNIIAVNGVESAHASPQRFQAISPQEVMAIIQVTTSIVQSSAALLMAFAALHAAWQKVKALYPGLKAPKVEVGLDQIPIDQVTEDQIKELVED